MRHSIECPRCTIGPVQHVVHLGARRDHDLALHQVDIGHHLRHRMLHLDARVHLDEVQPPVLIHQELDRPRIPIPDLRQRLAENLANLIPQFRSHLRRRRFLQQLLMPPLDRALALAQAHDIAVLVGQHLKLNVPRMLDVLLHVQIAVAERARPPPPAPP